MAVVALPLPGRRALRAHRNTARGLRGEARSIVSRYGGTQSLLGSLRGLARALAQLAIGGFDESVCGPGAGVGAVDHVVVKSGLGRLHLLEGHALFCHIKD